MNNKNFSELSEYRKKTITALFVIALNREKGKNIINGVTGKRTFLVIKIQKIFLDNTISNIKFSYMFYNA